MVTVGRLVSCEADGALPPLVKSWLDAVYVAPVGSVAGRTGAVVLTKADVGLSNVNDTADAAKPVSAAQQTALDGKAPLASPAFTGTPTGITKAHIGLGLADNTADAVKAVLSATKLATARTINGVNFDGTANVTVADGTKEPALPAGGTAAMYLRGDKAWQTLNPTAVGLGSVDNTSDATKNAAAVTLTNKTLASPTITGTPTGISKAHVGLGSVDNTADTAKPVSTAQQTAINGREPAIAAGTTGQYWRGDKTWVALPMTPPGSKWYISDGTTPDYANVGSPNPGDMFLYPNSGDTFRYNGSGWDYAGSIRGPQGVKGDTGAAGAAATNLVTSVAGRQGVVTLVKGDVGLGSVDNTADTAKPVSTAQQTAINNAVATKVNGSAAGTATALTLWTGTQAQYDAIGTKDNATVYVVT